ncbi:MAG TPA: DUF1284 domain-containing protein [Devosiaceae bacterium]
MTVRLRPHHLLCMLTYVGKGYTPAFTASYDAIVQRLGKGEDILLVAGPDDICAPLCGTAEDHCGNESPAERDRSAAIALEGMLDAPVVAGRILHIDTGTLDDMRRAFASGLIRSACAGCQWFDLCSRVAAEGFAGARLAIATPAQGT